MNRYRIQLTHGVRQTKWAFLVWLACIVSLGCQSGPQVRKLATDPGPEDLAVAHSGGQALIVTATADRRLVKFPPRSPDGRIWYYDPGKNQPGFVTWYSRPQKAPPNTNTGFVPLGLAIVSRSEAPGVEGRQLLYVINSRPGSKGSGGSVEVFEIVGRQLNLLGTLGGVSPLLGSANGIAAARDGSVYVSNFNPFPRRQNIALDPREPERYRSGSVVRFSPGDSFLKGSWKVVADGLNGPNGLALNEEETQLLVNVYHERTVIALSRKPEGGLCGSPLVVMEGLPFHPDNLKRTGSKFTAAGQRCFLAAGLHLLWQGFPVRGGAICFDWNGQHASHERDRSHIIRSDTRSPSVVIPKDGLLYVGHIVRPDVSIFPDLE